MRTSLLALLAALTVFAQADPALFDYDRNAPLDYREKPVRESDGVRVLDVTFASPKGGAVTAYLVTPARQGMAAGIVWQHGGGQDRQWFLPDAIELARAGAISILLDGPDQRPAALRAPRNSDAIAQAQATLVQVAVDIRRAVDLLASRPDIDKQRIGFAGLSFGAMMGATLAGFDRRFKCFVLMVGLEGFVRHYREGPLFDNLRAATRKEDLDRLYSVLAPVDNIHYIGTATAPMLFQAARFDLGVPAEHTYAFFEAAGSHDKVLQWYDSGHLLNDPRAAAGRIAWLKKRLKLR